MDIDEIVFVSVICVKYSNFIVSIYLNKISDIRYPADIDEIVFVPILKYSNSYLISGKSSGHLTKMSVSIFESCQTDGRSDNP